MNENFSFDCPLCKQTIETSIGTAGRKVRCPACQEPITIPQHVGPADPWAKLKQKYPNLQGKSREELDNCSAFLEKYVSKFCDATLIEEQEINIIAAAFKADIAVNMLKKYANVIFSNTMNATHKSTEELGKALFNDKKLNKQLNAILKEQGMKVKKKGIFGLFG